MNIKRFDRVVGFTRKVYNPDVNVLWITNSNGDNIRFELETGKRYEWYGDVDYCLANSETYEAFRAADCITINGVEYYGQELFEDTTPLGEAWQQPNYCGKRADTLVVDEFMHDEECEAPDFEASSDPTASAAGQWLRSWIFNDGMPSGMDPSMDLNFICMSAITSPHFKGPDDHDYNFSAPASDVFDMDDLLLWRPADN